MASSEFAEHAALLKRSKLFDAAWYLHEYPDVAMLGMDPVEHYLRFGARLGRNPGPKFDGERYLSLNSEVARAGTNPLVHYLRRLKAEARGPGVAPSNAAVVEGPLASTERVESYRRSVENNPADDWSWCRLCIELGRVDRWAEALECYAVLAQRKFFEQHAGDAQVQCLLGQIAFCKQDLVGAEGSLRRALAIQPGIAAAHCWLGLVLYNTQRFDEAENAFSAALQHDPQYPLAREASQELAARKRGDTVRAQLSYACENNPVAGMVFEGSRLTQRFPPARNLASIELHLAAGAVSGSGALAVQALAGTPSRTLGTWDIPFHAMADPGWLQLDLIQELSAGSELHVELTLEWCGTGGPALSLGALQLVPEYQGRTQSGPLERALAFRLWGVTRGQRSELTPAGVPRAGAFGCYRLAAASYPAINLPRMVAR